MEIVDPNSSPLTNPQEPSVIKPMPKTPYIAVAVIVTIASAVLIAWAFFKPAPPTKIATTVSNQPKILAQLKQEGFPKIPVSTKNAAVKVAIVSYRLSGTIKEVKPVSGGVELITDIKANIPRFLVTPNTKISIISNGEKKQASSSDLKAGQKVEIVITYGLKKRNWNDVNSVDIL